MKYCFTPLLLLLAFNFISCKKGNSSYSSLAGVWELRQEYLTTTPIEIPPGFRTRLKFTSDHKYESYDKDLKLIHSGTFHLTSEVSPADNKRYDVLQLDGALIRNTYVIKDFVLTLGFFHDGSVIVDGVTKYVYVRVE